MEAERNTGRCYTVSFEDGEWSREPMEEDNLSNTGI
jgi:hypothetical protein